MNLYQLRQAVAKIERENELLELAQLETDDGPPLPDLRVPGALADAYDKYVVWRDADTGAEARGLSDIQRRWLDQATCFRFDADWGRVSGSDAWLKSRKVRATSMIIGCLAIVMCCSRFRCATVIQKKTEDLGRDLWDRTREMIEALPRSWTGITDACPGLQSTSLEIPRTGSSWLIATAGSSRTVADKIGRSGTLNAVHLSEVSSYPHPDAVYAAVVRAMPERSGWLIAESTPPESRSHWFAREWFRSNAGEGVFRSCYFTPWHADPQRVITPDDPRYRSAMHPELEKRMGALQLAQEERLELTDEQRAWRRYTFFLGEPDIRRQAKRECPEDEQTCFPAEGDHVPYLDVQALDMVDAMVREPVREHMIARGWVGKAWATEAEHVLITTDSATFHGRDRSAVVAIDPWTRDLLAIVHGHCLPAWHLQGILWVLDVLGCRQRRRHTIAPERNYDERVGLVEDQLKPAELRGEITLYRETIIDPLTREQKSSQRVGYSVQDRNRGHLIEMITAYTEGVADPDQPDLWGPQCQIPSADLARELRMLTTWPSGKVQARKGEHDDLAIAWGGALMVAQHLKIRRRDTPITAPYIHKEPQIEIHGGIKTHGRDYPR